MGYCIYVRRINVKINRCNETAAMAAIRSLVGKETIKDDSGRHFSWVDRNFPEKRNLPDMMKCWRWECVEDGNYFVVEEFLGEKYGDDEILFTAIAPYIEAGSEIHFIGEDGNEWKYVFDGKTMKELIGRTVFE